MESFGEELIKEKEKMEKDHETQWAEKGKQVQFLALIVIKMAELTSAILWTNSKCIFIRSQIWSERKNI